MAVSIEVLQRLFQQQADRGKSLFRTPRVAGSTKCLAEAGAGVLTTVEELVDGIKTETGIRLKVDLEPQKNLLK